MSNPSGQDPSSKEPRIVTPEQIGALFFNERGEMISTDLELFANQDTGPYWKIWAAQHLPVDIYREFGMVEVEGSENWLNVVEHNVFVAATALTIGERLVAEGVPVDLNTVVRSAIIHDVNKRLDVERIVPREEEASDETFESVVKGFGYTDEEIDASKNTGRLPDRYINDPIERMSAIVGHTIEATIVGYADARTRNTHCYTIEESMNGNIAAKPKDKEFFTQNWRLYYEAIERYLQALAPGFDPSQINDPSIFETVQNTSTTS